MSIQLKNEHITAKILKHGAELKSLKRIGDETEYMWSADPSYWNRHSPVLFPIVGRVVNNEYTVDGQTYHLDRHGFARDMDFEVIKQSEAQVSLLLKWDEKTLKVYPYKFEFIITYTLKDNQISIEYRVNNVDDKTIYFSVGGHPGFNCPLQAGESYEDYYFEFEKNETAKIMLTSGNGLYSREKKLYLNNEKIIKLTDSLFKDDALVFEGLKSKSITLKSKKSDYSVRVDFEGFPLLGLWALPTQSPFVCIEPWVGHADFSDFAGDFSAKEDQMSLDVSKHFIREFTITIK